MRRGEGVRMMLKAREMSLEILAAVKMWQDDWETCCGGTS